MNLCHEQCGSGEELHLGWECLMQGSLQRHNLIDRHQVAEIDQEISKNQTDVADDWNVCNTGVDSLRSRDSFQNTVLGQRR